MSDHGIPVTLLNFQMAPKLMFLISSGSKKKETRYACLSETRASYSQRIWAQVSSSTPHLLHIGLSNSLSKWRCLFRVLCPVRRPVTALFGDPEVRCLTLILRRSRRGTVWFYTSTSNKRAARPKLYTKSLTRDLKHMYSRLTLVRISINL